MSKFDLVHLGDNLPFQAGGILTSFSLTRTEIEARREQVIRILEKHAGDCVTMNEDSFTINLQLLFDSKRRRILQLLEENSILLDALFYKNLKIVRNWKNINDIKKTIICMKYSSNTDNLVDNYSFVENVVCEIIQDIAEGITNGFLEPTDKALLDLGKLIETKEWFLNSKEFDEEEVVC